MPDENIVITLQDKIDASIPNKLDDISNAAIGADIAIKTLQENLSTLNGGGIAALTTNLNQVSVATDELTAAQSAALDAITALGTAEAEASAAAETMAASHQLSAQAAAELEQVAISLAIANNNLAISSNNVLISQENLEQAQNKTAITVQNLARATDQATMSALRLANAQDKVTTGTNLSTTSLSKMGDMAERVAIRSILRFAIWTVAIMGTYEVIKTLVNASDNLLDTQNKVAESNAKLASSADKIVSNMRTEINLHKEGTSTYGTAGNQQERLNVLKAELIAQGPEYRAMLSKENISYQEILASVKAINDENLKKINSQIKETESKGPDTSWITKTINAYENLLSFTSGLSKDKLNPNSTIDKVSEDANLKKIQEYNDKLKPLYEARAALIKGAAETDGAYDKPNKNEESKSAAIAKTTAELLKQQNALSMLGTSKEEYNQLDQIEIQFANKKWTLGEDQIKQWASIINSNVEYSKVVAERDSIYNATQGAEDKYLNTTMAVGELLSKQIITHEQYNSAMSTALDTLKNYYDPLKKTNDSLDDQHKLLQLVGTDLQVATQMQELQNSLMIKYPDAWNKNKNAIKAKVEQNLHDNEVQSESQKIYATTTGTLNTFTAQVEALSKAMGSMNGNDVNTAKVNIFSSMFEGTDSELADNLSKYHNFLNQIDTLTAKGLMTEQERTRKSYIAQAKFAQTKYATQLDYASQFFGNLATLQNSGDRTLFEIGKAAAIAQATVSGVIAYMKALEAGPILGPILAASTAVATAAAIGQILNTKMSGYEAGGYTGNGGTSAIAGVVHGQEFVNNAASTAKNRPLLEAMNAGKSISVGNQVAVSIANYGTSKEFEVQQDDNQIRIIARDEAKKVVKTDTPNLVASHIANSNSPISKSLSQNTNVARRY